MWVTGIREVRHVEVPVLEDRRGPVMFGRQRRETQLPREAWARLLHFRVSLPQHAGGPCRKWNRPARLQLLADGNVAGWLPGDSALAWSLENLWPRLVAYYASYVPPMRLGAKGTPRGRRAA